MTLPDKPESELPKVVIDRACRKLAEHFELNHGFRRAANGRRLTRKRNNFVQEITYQANWHNQTGSLIEIWVHAKVKSAELKAWRSRHTYLFASDYVASAAIGQLQKPPLWLTWNLTRPSTRQMVIEKLQTDIERLAIPFFDRFEETSALVAWITQTDLTYFGINNAVELLLAFDCKAEAKITAINYLREHRSLVKDYERAFEKIDIEGIPDEAVGLCCTLAVLSYAFDLGKLTQFLRE